MRRKCTDSLIYWKKNPGRKPLILQGLRQTGKTWLLMDFGNKQYEHTLYINLETDRSAADYLSVPHDPQEVLLFLETCAGKPLRPASSLLILDNIQCIPQISTLLTSIALDFPQYHIASIYKGVVNSDSFSVHDFDILTLYPLDFEEFLWANAEFALTREIRNHFSDFSPMGKKLHEKALSQFRLYLIIGGMPAAVEKYRATGSIDDVMDEHRAIIEQYKLDFTQYEEENRKLIITHIYELIPAELNCKNKRFMIADIKKGLRYDRVEDSFTWLCKAGVALGVFNTTEPTVPLMLNEKSTLFKLFLSDVGLLTTIYGKACKLKIVSKEKDINKGAVYENVVAQELHAHGYPLYYYNSKKKGELDFVIEHAGQVLPIEVKSGKDYEKHSALDNVMSAKEYGIREACVFTNGNVKTDGKLNYYPIYMVMFLQDDMMDFIDISVDRFRL